MMLGFTDETFTQAIDRVLAEAEHLSPAGGPSRRETQ
jgi:hypothetical protein